MKDVTAFVLGGHGDDGPPCSLLNRCGIPLPDLVEMGWTTKKNWKA